MEAENFLSDRLDLILDTTKYKYYDQHPYPFAQIDNFLDKNFINEIYDEFPTLNSSKWINYKHFNENKFGNTKLNSFPPKIKELITYLNCNNIEEQLNLN